MTENDYNKRLFNKSSLRGKIHNARFTWLQKNIAKYSANYKSILELGCFDGKVINYLPHLPTCYEGWDANWEGGLDIAKKAYENQKAFKFYECESYKDFKPTRSEFDISVCMETLEHLPIYNYEEYITELANCTSSYLFVTIPNEKKIPFVLKYLVKSTLLRKQKLDAYSWKEVYHAAVGRLDLVKRINTSHKGFDYEKMIEILSKYFKIESIEGVPFKHLGTGLNFTIGVVCRAL